MIYIKGKFAFATKFSPLLSGGKKKKRKPCFQVTFRHFSTAQVKLRRKTERN